MSSIQSSGSVSVSVCVGASFSFLIAFHFLCNTIRSNCYLNSCYYYLVSMWIICNWRTIFRYLSIKRDREEEARRKKMIEHWCLSNWRAYTHCFFCVPVSVCILVFAVFSHRFFFFMWFSKRNTAQEWRDWNLLIKFKNNFFFFFKINKQTSKNTIQSSWRS